MEDDDFIGQAIELVRSDHYTNTSWWDFIDEWMKQRGEEEIFELSHVPEHQRKDLLIALKLVFG